MLVIAMADALEAHRWVQNGDHPDDDCHDVVATGDVGFPKGTIFKSEGKVVRYFRHPGIPGEKICAQCARTMHEHGWIDEGGDGLNVCPGDWIVTMPGGKHVPFHEGEFLVKFAMVQQQQG